MPDLAAVGRHRQAVHLRRRRRPVGDRPGPRPRRDRAVRPGGAQRLPALRRARRPHVRLRQRRGDGRRHRAGPALRLPHDVDGRGSHVAARGLPRPHPRLGRRVAAAQPHRPGECARGHHRQPDAAEPADEAQGRAAPRRRRRPARAGRLPRAVDPLGRRSRQRRRSTSPGRSRIATSWDGVVEIARAMLDDRIHGATPAPYVALDLVQAAKTGSRDEGFAAEDDALADLVMGDDLRASLYSFDLVQKRAKRPVGVPDKSLARKVTKVGVVGAGLMASQLALLFAKRLQVPGRHDRPRRRARREGPRLRARRPRGPGGQGPADPGQGEPAERPGHRVPPTRRPSPTPTS